MKFPLFIVTGVSGSGKSITAEELRKVMVGFDVFDMDVIVNNNDYQTACSNWLKIAYYNALSGRNTILFGNVPEPYNIHICDHSHFFGPIHYLYLHCNDDVRTQRLHARKVWDAVGIQQTLDLSKEMADNARNAVPPIPILDTTNTPLSQIVNYIKKWALDNSSYKTDK
ncbi:AAA family ATPase [Peribacillus muralis]|uniref:AAA family ATPase n=1 Tax=Peribacillus muralis TaxID=264697 RepID=UPI003CFEEC1A